MWAIASRVSICLPLFQVCAVLLGHIVRKKSVKKRLIQRKMEGTSDEGTELQILDKAGHDG